MEKEKLLKAKTKVHFKNWAILVKSNNLAYKIPEELIESLDPKLDKYVSGALDDLGLVFINGLWERK